MKPTRIKRILTAAAGVPVPLARRVLAAVLAKQDADPMDELRAALREDLKPLGDALFAASQAGDEPAMRAALRKISNDMPDFMASAALEDVLGREFLTALTEP